MVLQRGDVDADGRSTDEERACSLQIMRIELQHDMYIYEDSI